MAQDHHLGFPQLVLIRGEGPAQCGASPEDIEGGRRGPGSRQFGWFPSAGQCDGTSKSNRRHRLENSVLALPIQKIERRDAVAVSAWRFFPHQYNTVWILIRQWFQ